MSTHLVLLGSTIAIVVWPIALVEAVKVLITVILIVVHDVPVTLAILVGDASSIEWSTIHGWLLTTIVGGWQAAIVPSISLNWSSKMIQVIGWGSIIIHLRSSPPVGLATCCSSLLLTLSVFLNWSVLSISAIVSPQIRLATRLNSLSGLASLATPVSPGTPGRLLRLGVVDLLLLLTILVSSLVLLLLGLFLCRGSRAGGSILHTTSASPLSLGLLWSRGSVLDRLVILVIPIGVPPRCLLLGISRPIIRSGVSANRSYIKTNFQLISSTSSNNF